MKPSPVNRDTLLRGLKARVRYATRRQQAKLMNDNGWCYWEGQKVVLDKLIKFYAKRP